jgi:hypothetical protein
MVAYKCIWLPRDFVKAFTGIGAGAAQDAAMVQTENEKWS